MRRQTITRRGGLRLASADRGCDDEAATCLDLFLGLGDDRPNVLCLYSEPGEGRSFYGHLDGRPIYGAAARLGDADYAEAEQSARPTPPAGLRLLRG